MSVPYLVEYLDADKKVLDRHPSTFGWFPDLKSPKFILDYVFSGAARMKFDDDPSEFSKNFVRFVIDNTKYLRFTLDGRDTPSIYEVDFNAYFEELRKRGYKITTTRLS